MDLIDSAPSETAPPDEQEQDRDSPEPAVQTGAEIAEYIEPQPAVDVPEAEQPKYETPIADAEPEGEPIEPQETSSEAAIPEINPVELKALLEAIIYVSDEPLSALQIAHALSRPAELVARMLRELMEEYVADSHGLMIREVAGGYKMGTKPEHHEAIRTFVKNLKPPLKLSMAALETLAVIAYKQPITGPEILDIRGVQGGGVLKTLLDRKLITTAGRKNVVGKPILYRTTKEFLIQFGLKDISELPTLKEFEELRRLALSDPEPEFIAAPAPVEQMIEAEEAAKEPTDG